MKKKIAVALSGGVDSSVTAALLQDQGHEVVGFHLVCWNAPGCPAEQDKEDARRVAGKLNIPFYVFDAVEEYRNLIIDEMIKEYAAGRTPNPDVWCNERIKFGFLLDKARLAGFDMLATGHYARLKKSPLLVSSRPQPSEVERSHDQSAMRSLDKLGMTARLYRGADSKKDQSYFLWRLNQDQLAAALFPLGDKQKSEVRELAKKYNLHTAAKKDSQGVCFVGELDMRAFIKKHISMENGPIKLLSGKTVSEHDGLFQYTIGQRATAGGAGPFYVVRLDQKENTVWVTNDKNDSALFTKSAQLENIHWISGQAPATPFVCSVDVRYHTEPMRAILRGDKLEFDRPVRAVTPGQSAVMYVGDELVGGGIIRQ